MSGNVRTRVGSNVTKFSPTGALGDILDAQRGYFSLAHFGYDITSGESVVPYVKEAVKYLVKVGFGQVYIPPNGDNNYPVLIKRFHGQTVFEYWGVRFPMNNETRPYTGERFRKGDVIHNVNPPEEGVMGWVCYQDSESSTIGEWRAWGELKRFCSEAQKVSQLPPAQAERESQIMFCDSFAYICKYSTDQSKWIWDRFVFDEEFEALGDRVTNVESASDGNADRIEEVNTELLKKLAALESGLDWRESVDTFADIATTYPDAEDGWTVNVKDTDITYRYDGENWIPISANSIPLASQTVPGKMSAEDKTKLDGLVQGYTLVRSGAGAFVGPDRTKMTFLSDKSSAVGISVEAEGTDEVRVQVNPSNVAYCELSSLTQDYLQSLITKGVANIMIQGKGVQLDTPKALEVTVKKVECPYLSVTFLGVRSQDLTLKFTVEGAGTEFSLVSIGDKVSVSFEGDTPVIKMLKGIKVTTGDSYVVIFAEGSEFDISQPGEVTAFNSKVFLLTMTSTAEVSIKGRMNTVSAVTQFEGQAVVPFDTTIGQAPVASILRDLTGSGPIKVLPTQTLTAISLSYYGDNSKYQAYLLKGTGAVSDEGGNAWQVKYTSGEVLTSDMISKLDDMSIGEFDYANRVVTVQRPIPKIYPCALADLPDERDPDTFYVCY